MDEKINIDLSGVPQTLLLPLAGRALFSQKAYSPIHDERAVQLVNSLNYDFDNLLRQFKPITLFWMARAYHFDQAIKTFLQKHPQAVIVNLGAGLETAFYRVDNDQLTWVDLDLPEVIRLREKLLPPHERVLSIAKSILDYSWMSEIKALGNDIFFFAGGLFMYFTPEQVKSTFITMADQFPNAELIFDAISEKTQHHANKMLSQAKMSKAVMHWSLEDGKELEGWSTKIKVLSQVSNFKNIKTKSKFPFSLRMKMFLYDAVSKDHFIHLKFEK